MAYPTTRNSILLLLVDEGMYAHILLHPFGVISAIDQLRMKTRWLPDDAKSVPRLKTGFPPELVIMKDFLYIFLIIPSIMFLFSALIIPLPSATSINRPLCRIARIASPHPPFSLNLAPCTH
jgi:hypothetical protein